MYMYSSTGTDMFEFQFWILNAKINPKQKQICDSPSTLVSLHPSCMHVWKKRGKNKSLQRPNKLIQVWPYGRRLVYSKNVTLTTYNLSAVVTAKKKKFADLSRFAIAKLNCGFWSSWQPKFDSNTQILHHDYKIWYKTVSLITTNMLCCQYKHDT